MGIMPSLFDHFSRWGTSPKFYGNLHGSMISIIRPREPPIEHDFMPSIAVD